MKRELIAVSSLIIFCGLSQTLRVDAVGTLSCKTPLIPHEEFPIEREFQNVYQCISSTSSISIVTSSVTVFSIGASTLETLAGLARSSPTATVNFPYPAFLGSATSSSMTVTLNGSSVTLRGQAWSQGVDSQFLLVESDTSTLATNLAAGFTAVATSTAGIIGRLNNLDTSTGTIFTRLLTVETDTTTLGAIVNTKLGVSSITATAPIIYSNGVISLAQSINNYSQSFTNTTSVVLTHNASTTSIVVSCYDNSSPPVYIGFNSLALTSSNTATVTFTTPQTGTCVVNATGAGSGDNLGNHTATTMLTANYGIVTTTITVSTVTWIAQPSLGGFPAERCGKELQFTTAVSSSTDSGSYVPTNLTGTLSVHSTSSYVKIRVSADLITSAASMPAALTIFRNGSDISGSSGFVKISAGGGIILATNPILYDDTPSTTGNVTYTVAMLSYGGTISFCSSGFTCTMTLQECF